MFPVRLSGVSGPHSSDKIWQYTEEKSFFNKNQPTRSFVKIDLIDMIFFIDSVELILDADTSGQYQNILHFVGQIITPGEITQWKSQPYGL